MNNALYTHLERALGLSTEDFYAHLARRRIVPMVGKINGDLTDDVTKTLVLFDSKECKPITLLISSNGGDVPAAGKIMDTIAMLRSPVHGLVFGRAASMAVDVLLACDTQSGTAHSEYFVHFTRCGFECVSDSDTFSAGDLQAIRNKFLGYKSRREAFYAKKLKTTKAKIHELFRRGEKFNLDYDAEDALKLGIIQRIETKFKFFDRSLPAASAK